LIYADVISLIAKFPSAIVVDIYLKSLFK